jgi:TolB-like protein/DNA-binding winged helix-turn-helix (wHTH) protein
LPLTSYQFGDFELDCARYELRRNGHALKLEHIPMELLILLIEKEGAVVNRQEIVERLWGKDVFVDTEHGINTAIRKIRATLRDDAEKPRFVQTVLGKGYRFIGEPAPVQVAQPIAREPQSDLKKEIAPSRHKRSSAIVGTAVLTLIALLLLGWNLKFRDRSLAISQPPIRSIAVLPLVNLSGDHSQDYFADGMTDELITMLAKNTNLRVVSRTSVMRYKGVSRPMHEIAKELGTDGILEGSISRSSNRLHLTVQLVQGETDAHIWAESYDRNLEDAVALVSELSQTISKQINVATSLPTRARKEISPEAHDAYLRGRYFWFGDNLQRSQEFFKKAIEIQPDYAEAWSGLADAYVVQAVDNQISPSKVMDKAEEAARKAAQLDDSLAEVHRALAGLYLFGRWDWKAADAEALRSLSLDPNLAETHHLRAYILEVMNRGDEALQEQRRSSELDPFARSWALAKVLTQQRKFAAAEKELILRSEAQPQEVYLPYMLSDVYRFEGKFRESAEQIEKGALLEGDKKSAAIIRRAFESGGEKAVAEWLYTQTKAKAAKQYISPLNLAFGAARLKRKEETLKLLEDAHRERSPWLVLVQNDPEFDFLHAESRYRAIIQKMGLPPAY